MKTKKKIFFNQIFLTIGLGNSSLAKLGPLFLNNPIPNKPNKNPRIPSSVSIMLKAKLDAMIPKDVFIVAGRLLGMFNPLLM